MQSPAHERTEARLRIPDCGVVEFERAFVIGPRRDRAVSRRQPGEISIAVEGDREGAILSLDAHPRTRRDRRSVVLHDFDQCAARSPD